MVIVSNNLKRGGRPGGDKRGNASARRARKHWMLKAFPPYNLPTVCSCVHCGATLTFDTVEADRIVPGASYRRENIQPACRPCNASRSDKVDWIPPLAR